MTVSHPEAALSAREAEALTLTALHEANIARQAEWCPDQVPDLSFRGNELAGETGEACNVIKKLERERQGWRGSRATMADLAEELADVVICADLCAVTAGIDLSAAVVAKFNATSGKVGISVRLPLAQAPAVQAPAGEESLQAVVADALEILPLTADALESAQGERDEVLDDLIERLRAASPTPTDAQPNPAGPVGEEALKGRPDVLAAFATAQKLPPLPLDPDPVSAVAALAAAARSARHDDAGNAFVLQHIVRVVNSFRASHPTTGQETVATPRDGGVREALAEGIMGLLRRTAEQPSSYHASLFPDEARQILAALLAPGSAGPGEHIQHVKSGGWYEVLTRDAQVQTSEPLADYAFVAVYRNVITGATWVRPVSEMDDGRFRPAPAHPAALATSSPAQEPGTGDTGERVPDALVKPLKELLSGYYIVEALLASMDADIPDGQPVSVKAGNRKHEIALYGDFRQLAHALSRLATPATTAETPGPAEGAR